LQVTNTFKAPKLFSVGWDTSQAKADGKEMITSMRQEGEAFLKNAPSIVLNELNKPENKEKCSKILPEGIVKLFNGSEKDRQDVIQYFSKNIVKGSNDAVTAVCKEAQDQKLYENLYNALIAIMPSPWYFARYGFIFGASVFAGFNGLYYAQQVIKDYLAIRKPKYLSPLSSVGVLDQYKQLIKNWIYGFKKQKNDVEVQIIVDRLQTMLFINDNGKKQYNNFFIRNNVIYDNTRLFGAVAQKLDMDFIAVPSINLLQKNNIVEIWNELIQIIHKNNRPVLLYIDQAELLSMDGTEYSEREDNIRILASCVKSSMAVFKGKCIIIGLSRNKEDLQGPFSEIFTKQFTL
jgi:hypothetical protein